MAKPSKYTYHTAATVKDELDGSVYTLGSTIETMSIEISGNTHPFYTGQETLIDTAGRIEKFNTRKSQATGSGKTDKVRANKGKQKMTLSDMIKEDSKATPAPVKKPVKAKKEVTEVTPELPLESKTDSVEA